MYYEVKTERVKHKRELYSSSEPSFISQSVYVWHHGHNDAVGVRLLRFQSQPLTTVWPLCASASSVRWGDRNHLRVVLKIT